ncbi:(E2-independent) E3 ubiquitin-conjugating enzyme FATS isoform X1 [Anomaloglossus baeobatrachus]|uniref:(E2-independent) E3 ubiquitin-conjugating enzyme FATS isoform X1 n=1 Tax=Anomaloglossus baeobatrachus TaxID=238106 RepID=UPI003F505DD0
MGKTFLTQVHLTVYYTIKKKECYFGLSDCKESSANIERKDDQNEQNLKMIDEAEAEDDRKLHPSQSVITEPITTRMRPSMVNQNSISIKRTLSSLPGKLEIVTSSDRTVCRTNLHPAKEKHSLDGKKGFSSITITARRYITSLYHAPKEITSDPASSLCRSNDLLMKAPVSAVEHNQQCGFLDNRADCSQNFKPFGFTHSQELPCRPSRVFNEEVDHQYLKDSSKQSNRTTYISGIHVKRDKTFPDTIYYRHKLYSLSLGQCHVANQRTYKSELSVRIKRPLKSRLDQTFDRKSVEPPSDVFRDKFVGECQKSSSTIYERPNPSAESQYETLKKHQRNQEHQVNGYHRDPCQDVSGYLNTDAFDYPQTLKKDPPPVREIYVDAGSPLRSFGHLGAERSSVTTFNFIFGKQISIQNKLNLQKENISRKGYKWRKSCGNIGRSDKENVPVPELTENKPGGKPLHKKNMSLQEALERHRPDFINNSQERVQKLELMARRRKIQKQDPKSTLQKHTLRLINEKRKVFTTPHPLSDNLFKPKERTISEKEMQQRSKRIYNSLPEVKKRKDEEEKRMITQSNRARAQLFKKKMSHLIDVKDTCSWPVNISARLGSLFSFRKRSAFVTTIERGHLAFKSENITG